ncbi:MAG TPA: hypothetical protein VL356_01205 [Acidocella sp.]|nr:hypothetical protein [Acidocella sp.]
MKQKSSAVAIGSRAFCLGALHVKPSGKEESGRFLKKAAQKLLLF